MLSYSVHCVLRRNCPRIFRCINQKPKYAIERNFSHLGSHYDILRVRRDASLKDIKTAYISLCKKLHPDSNPDDSEAQVNFVRLNEAYTVLSDPQKRSEYDVTIGVQHEDKRNESRGAPDLSHHDLIWEMNYMYDKQKNMSDEEIMEQRLKEQEERYRKWYEEYKVRQKAEKAEWRAPPPTEEETAFRETASEYKEAFHREGTKHIEEEEFSWPVLFGLLLHSSAQLGIFLV
ncbi:chaperone protein DnaJ-like isoform X2 [Ostrea edulis]|nr:chaperone protein DnaJ-like isoform X2 [Ostrea edulis]XP_056021693.1 chaperone protein DnaJ-like isoform X2 [Ostrea edulis]XP_056021694.1 chaperone protein DnaJ-like isoform X2 [Ostrea edulis]